MYRASDLLKKTREDNYLTTKEVASQLKIPQKYILAIESDHIKNLPQEPYCSLIVKSYAEFLKLDGNNILRLFRRDFATKNDKKTIRKRVFGFTPQLTFSLATILAIIAFSAFLIFEYFKFNRPPRLDVSWPKDSLALGENLSIEGQTDSQANVTINDSLVIVDAEGHFKKDIVIKTLPITITVQSKSPNGKTTIDQRQYQP